MKLSVIIPALNEEKKIAQTINRTIALGKQEIHEIIVVDGGSEDTTIIKATEAGSIVFESPDKGRAVQMNYGAQKATGDVLYFLHADSLPSQNFTSKIKKSIHQGYDAGCFQLGFDQESWLLNLYAWFTRFDVNAFHFGDQSLFITRSAFFAIGKFRENHMVMEDNELVRRIKKHYSFILLDDIVTTSARKYQRVGVLKLQLVFILIYTLYMMGVSQEKLDSFYKRMIK